MRRITRSWPILLLLIILFFITWFFYLLRIPMADNQIYVYDQVTEKIVYYDTKQKKILNAWDENQNVHQYTFPTNNTLLVSGNIKTKHFKLINLTKNKITDLLHLPRNQVLLPAFIDRNNAYFIRVYYAETGKESFRRIAVYNLQTKKLRNLPLNPGRVLNLSKNNNHLLFTQSTKSDLKRIVYQTNLLGTQTPVVQNISLHSAYYVTGKTYLVNDFNQITIKKRPIPIGDFNYFSNQLLLSFTKKELNRLYLSIYSLINGNLLKRFDNVIGFSTTNTMLTIYLNGKILAFSFQELK